jgi:hypothetical protein
MEGAVYIQNDISLKGANITGLDNGLFPIPIITATAPEPALVAPVLAVGLLGFGLIVRRRRAKLP